jgi:hypothetical protein
MANTLQEHSRPVFAVSAATMSYQMAPSSPPMAYRRKVTLLSSRYGIAQPATALGWAVLKYVEVVALLLVHHTDCIKGLVSMRTHEHRNQP